MQTNFVTGTRNYTGPNGRGDPRTSFVNDMDNFVAEFLADVSPRDPRSTTADPCRLITA